MKQRYRRDLLEHKALTASFVILGTLTQPSFSGAADIDQIRSRRYKTNQLTQYSSFMHLGILIQGLIPPVAELFSLFFTLGAKTSLQKGHVNGWDNL